MGQRIADVRPRRVSPVPVGPRPNAQVLQKLMWHANIKTRMDYYANVDDAVMEAVLGDKRNRIRNNAAQPEVGDGSENATDF